MPYYIRLFSRMDDAVHVSRLWKTVASVRGQIDILRGDASRWQEVLVKLEEGREICLLDRATEELNEEILEFLDELEDSRPQSGVAWVRDYLRSTKVIYTCQFLSLTNEEEYLPVPGELLWGLKLHLGSGIIQADGEGFSNEDGFQVTWDFADSAAGPWKMAILGEGGKWINFEMDLGNVAHRAAFLAGRLPPGVDPIP